jgi:hypothetical protein
LELKVKNKKEVLSILPAVFEEFIDIDGLKYYVKSIFNNKYVCFAYNENKILDAIKTSKIETNKIKGIFFGQIELFNLIKNDPNSSIDGIHINIVDDILIQTPNILKKESLSNIDISNIKLSSDKIDINKNSKYIDKSVALSISLIFSVIFVVNIIKSIYNVNYKNIIDEKIETIKSNVNLPKTSMQTKSIMFQLKKRESKQRRIRELIHYVLRINRFHSVKIVSMEFFDNQIICKFENNNRREVLNYISKKYTINSRNIIHNQLVIGIKV